MIRPGVLLMTILMLTACARLVPDVKPYEREQLADPIMSFSKDVLSDQHRNHVYDVREAARGATTTEGGGCGCN